MANARIAALVVAFFSSTLVCQEPQKIHLTLRVTDQTGAVVSGARIKVDPISAASPDAAIADKNGEAGLDIPAGTHLFLIMQPGFSNWTRTIDVQSNLQSIEVVLDVAGTMDPVVISWQPNVQVEQSLLSEFIPLQPLLNLEPLPALRPRRRW